MLRVVSGVYQCGPCPLAAIKSGEINVGFDTGFVFSEVNAEVVHWVVDADGEVITHSAIKKDQSVQFATVVSGLTSVLRLCLLFCYHDLFF